jgi:beta-glucosidase
MWGVSTSAYQTEDPGPQQDFQTDWDLFYDDGRVSQGRGQGALSWSEPERDQRALNWLGVSHYRFGIEWARIEPSPGVYNEEALQSYVAKAIKLKQAGIEPVVCLWHFTFPDWGTALASPNDHGWRHPLIKRQWIRYVEKVITALAPHVQLFAPQNEPNAQAMAGWFMGMWPPGIIGDLTGMNAQVKASADAFKEAASLIKQLSPTAKVITIQNIVAFSQAPWDYAKAFINLGARYNFEHLDLVQDSADIIGFNYYYRREACPGPAPSQIWPEGIRWAIETLCERYDKPVIIMENGLGTDNDLERQSYLHNHIAQVIQAQSMGYDVRGYFAWSLMDNYEWALGYSCKYGLMAITKNGLVPKGSAEQYRLIIQASREAQDAAPIERTDAAIAVLAK